MPPETTVTPDSVETPSPEVTETTAPVTEPTTPPEGSGGQPDNGEETFEWSGRKLKKDEFLAEAQKMQSEFTKRSAELNELKKFKEEHEAKLSQDQAKTQDPTANMSPEEKQQYEQIVESMMPFLLPKLQDKLQNVAVSTYEQHKQAEASTQQYVKEFERVEELGKQYGFSVSRNELGEYMIKEGIGNVNAAFQSKYFKEIMDAEIKTKMASQKKIPDDNGGDKVPSTPAVPDNVKVTDKNFKDALVEKMKSFVNNG